MTSAADSGAGTLRDAIIAANGHAGADRILFALPPGTVIGLTSALPYLMDNGGVAIDGGNAVALDASQVTSGYYQIRIYSSNNTIANLTLRGGTGSINGIYVGSGTNNLISHNTVVGGSYGINLYNPGSQATVADNAVSDVVNYGVYAAGGANCTITGNTIARAGYYGVSVRDSGTVATIEGNSISDIGNSRDGITVTYGAQVSGIRSNTLQSIPRHGIYVYAAQVGTIAANRIVTSGSVGILVSGAGTRTVVQGNIVGPCAFSGIDVREGAQADSVSGNEVGDAPYGIRVAQAAGQTLVSDNRVSCTTDRYYGVYVLNSAALVEGNNVSGRYHTGVRMEGAVPQGGTDTANKNTVLGVAIHGISLCWGASGTISNNTVTNSGYSAVLVADGSQGTMIGNNVKTARIGLQVWGESGYPAQADITQNTVTACSMAGVYCSADAATSVSGNVHDNQIHDNSGRGVVVATAACVTVARNSIYRNGSLGIDLGYNGVTYNDLGDLDAGPNGLQNYPRVRGAVHAVGQTTITGTLNSQPTRSYAIDLYANSSSDPLGYGEGETYLGTAMCATDVGGDGTWALTVPGDLSHTVVTATATDPDGNTSEFSGNTAPVAVQDGYQATEDLMLNVSAPGLLSNDRDRDTDGLVAVKKSEASHGEVNVNADGSFTYLPTTNYNGPDSFTYAANDGIAESTPVTVTLTVDGRNDAPIAEAGSDQTVEADATGGATVTLDGSGSSDVDGDTLTYLWTWTDEDGATQTATDAKPTIVLPVGETTVTLVVNDGQVDSAADTVKLTVTDTKPPTVTDLTASPNQLWPPNGKMRDVTLAYTVADIVDASCDVALTVTCNEADFKLAEDVQQVDKTHLKLRATRDGQSKDGRIYTITVTAQDAAGNTNTATTTVTVPHDQSAKSQSLLSVSGVASTGGGGITQITVRSTAPAEAQATICNIAGRPIARLTPQMLTNGLNTMLWNGRSITSTVVPRGRYLVTVTALGEDGTKTNCVIPLQR